MENEKRKSDEKVEVPYGILCSAVGLLKTLPLVAADIIGKNEIEVDEKSTAILKAGISVAHGMAKDFGLADDDLVNWAAVSSAIAHLGGEE